MQFWKSLTLLLGLTLGANPFAAPSLKTVGIYVGNNNFPGLQGSDLRGYINDANQYADAFQLILGNVEEHRLTNATLGTFTAEFQQAIRRCRSGEIGRLILTIASHGTSSPAADGKSAVQAIVFSDVNAAMTVGLLEDTKFRSLLDQIPTSVGVELILDTCFSGGATRDLAATRSIFKWNPRYVAHPRFRPGLQRIVPRAVRSVGPEHRAEWAACSEKETSADALLGGEWHGAFTYAWVRNFRLHRDQKRSALLQAVQNEITQFYGQTPQLLTQ